MMRQVKLYQRLYHCDGNRWHLCFLSKPMIEIANLFALIIRQDYSLRACVCVVVYMRWSYRSSGNMLYISGFCKADVLTYIMVI